MAGYERYLIPRIGQMFTAMERDFPVSLQVPRSPGLVFGKGNTKDEQRLPWRQYRKLSPNQWDMGVNCELFRAAVWGTPAEYESAKEVVLHSLDLHLREIGLMLTEQCTGRPHGGMYEDAIFAGRAGARHKGDTELLAENDELLRALFTYKAGTVTPGGQIWCCGERMPGGPAAQQQSAVWREVKGIPHKGELSAREIADHLQEDAWVCLRGLRALMADGDTLAGVKDIKGGSVTEMPHMARKIEVLRWPGGHLSRYVERLEGKQAAGVCDWVLVDHAEADRGSESRKDLLRGVSFGVEFKTPVPLGIPREASAIRSVDRRRAA